MEIEVRAPGKVILHGEHAVVYGTKAIAISVGLNTIVRITKSTGDTVELRFSEVGIDASFTLEELKALRNGFGDAFSFQALSAGAAVVIDSKVQSLLEGFVSLRALLNCEEGLKPAAKAAFEAFLFMYLAIFGDLSAITVEVETELPVGAGLGSSASFGVALAGGLLLSCGRMKNESIDKELINRWAYASECFVHGNPSGLDNSIVTYGGAVLFRKGEPFSNLKCSEIRVLLVNTEVPRSTKDLVAKVAKLRETNPEKHQKIIQDIDQLVRSVASELESNGRTSSNYVTLNQDLLSELSVSHPKIDLIVNLAKANGFSAKLTGAGGGGCVFVYLPPGTQSDPVDKLKSSLLENGFSKLWDITLGGIGFHVKQ